MLTFLLKPVKLGALFGIPILVMPAVGLMVALVLAWAADQAGSAGVGSLLVMLTILVISLLAHELGHALVARRLGLRVLDITIWPLGGMARLEGMADQPSFEGPVALAGPVVNLGLAAVFVLLPGPIGQQAMLINLVLGLGNLLPAFPLDGGRVLRAWLARHSPLVDATGAAVKVATFLSIALLLVSAYTHMLLMGVLLAGYIWWVGRMELFQVILRSGRAPQLGFTEVLARAWRRGRPRNSTAAPDPSAAPADAAADAGVSESGLDRRELEDFRGSLDEFFRRSGRP